MYFIQSDILFSFDTDFGRKLIKASNLYYKRLILSKRIGLLNYLFRKKKKKEKVNAATFNAFWSVKDSLFSTKGFAALAFR